VDVRLSVPDGRVKESDGVPRDRPVLTVDEGSVRAVVGKLRLTPVFALMLGIDTLTDVEGVLTERPVFKLIVGVAVALVGSDSEVDKDGVLIVMPLLVVALKIDKDPGTDGRLTPVLILVLGSVTVPIEVVGTDRVGMLSDRLPRLETLTEGNVEGKVTIDSAPDNE
jgi:hypothetical protein